MQTEALLRIRNDLRFYVSRIKERITEEPLFGYREDELKLIAVIWYLEGALKELEGLIPTVDTTDGFPPP